MSESVAIKVNHVSKSFKLPHDRATSIKGNLINVLKKRHGYELQHALHDIDFEVKEGEFFGIVGKNGGGKSTLLKIISGIYTPTKGNVETSGKLTPFIELGVGFNPELTGRENVFLNGALLGFNRSEMEAMYDDIVEFAELTRFMDQKLKNYSSGMQVRLAFSIAIRAESDILVMDEVLAVGDAAFQKKCFDIFRELKKQKRTIILVTHDMANVEKFCDRVLVIDKGKQLGIVTPSEASTLYARLNVNENLVQKDAEGNERIGTGEVMVEKVRFSSNGKPTKVLTTGAEFTLHLKLRRKAEGGNKLVNYGLAFYDSDDRVIAGPNNLQQAINSSTTEVTFTVSSLPLAPGEYKLTTALYDENMEVMDLIDKKEVFSVISDHQVHGLIDMEGTWKPRA